MTKTARTAGELKKLLLDVPDDAVILKESDDHSYVTTRAAYISVIRGTTKGRPNGDWWEDFGPEYDDDEGRPGVRVHALVIGG